MPAINTPQSNVIEKFIFYELSTYLKDDSPMYLIGEIADEIKQFILKLDSDKLAVQNKTEGKDETVQCHFSLSPP